LIDELVNANETTTLTPHCHS